MDILIPALLIALFVASVWAVIRSRQQEALNPRSLCVIDGDTLWVLSPDRTVSEKLRLQNVNTPEIRRPRSRRELNRAVAATEFLRNSIGKARTLTSVHCTLLSDCLRFVMNDQAQRNSFEELFEVFHGNEGVFTLTIAKRYVVEHAVMCLQGHLQETLSYETFPNRHRASEELHRLIDGEA